MESSSLPLKLKSSCCFFPSLLLCGHSNTLIFLPPPNLMDLIVASSFQAFVHSLSFAVPAILLLWVDKIPNSPSSLPQLSLHTWPLQPFTFPPFWNNPLSPQFYSQHLDFPVSCSHTGSFRHSPFSSSHSICFGFHTVLKVFFLLVYDIAKLSPITFAHNAAGFLFHIWISKDGISRNNYLNPPSAEMKVSILTSAL